ncbi:NAD-dependent epimerase/dehydratase family protein [Arthrobacter sp. D1-29]
MTVLLVGGSGFIGQNALQAIAARKEIKLRVLTRRTTALMKASEASIYVGDLMDRSTLQAALFGADAIINASSYTGADASKAEAVNHEGVRNLLSVAHDCGVPGFIQLSTTAVYGSGPHRGDTEMELACRPESTVSRTRRAAEELVLAAGGTVLRAGLIYGPGDIWFIPSLIRMATMLGGPVGDGESKLSVIGVEYLGGLIAGLLPLGSQIRGVFHAAEPVPVSVGQILQHIEDNVTGPRWSRSTDLAAAIALLHGNGLTEHQVALLSQDHWYQSDRLWTMAGVEPPRFGFSRAAAEWYRRL